MAVFTVAYDGYDNGTAYYVDGKQYAFIHVNDEYEKEDILLRALVELDIERVDKICVDDILDNLDYAWEWEYPKTLRELTEQFR